MSQCLICGEPATTLFSNNQSLPLCDLSSCEAALIDEINEKLQAAAEAEKENE